MKEPTGQPDIPVSTLSRKHDPTPDVRNMTIGEMLEYGQRQSNRVAADVKSGIKTLKAALVGLFALNIITLLAVIFI